LERSDLANRVVYDLQLAGFTQAQIDDFMKTFRLPKPGGVHAHNDKVILEVKSPDLHATDASVDARLFKHQCIPGYPEHWYGGGGDVNRATASEMDEPTFKGFGARQRLWKAIVEEVVGFAIREAKAVGALEQSADEAVIAQFPEMVQADLTKLSGAQQATGNAVSIARREAIITRAEGRQIFAASLKPLGIELEEMDDAELETMAADAAFAAASVDYLAGNAPANQPAVKKPLKAVK
jgi:hypothetical protein